MEAERQGLAHPEVFADSTAAAAANGSGKALALTAAATADSSSSSSKKPHEEPAGQEVDLAFPAWMKEGTYNLQLVVMSDCWVGADESMPVSLGSPQGVGGGGGFCTVCGVRGGVEVLPQCVGVGVGLRLVEGSATVCGGRGWGWSWRRVLPQCVGVGVGLGLVEGSAPV
jgi:hypothetical protein